MGHGQHLWEALFLVPGAPGTPLGKQWGLQHLEYQTVVLNACRRVSTVEGKPSAKPRGTAKTGERHGWWREGTRLDGRCAGSWGPRWTVCLFSHFSVSCRSGMTGSLASTIRGHVGNEHMAATLWQLPKRPHVGHPTRGTSSPGCAPKRHDNCPPRENMSTSVHGGATHSGQRGTAHVPIHK